MSSSRALAAARARRSGEQAPPVSGNRPGTSIHGQAAFAFSGGGHPPMHPSASVRVNRGPPLTAAAPPPPSYNRGMHGGNAGRHAPPPPPAHMNHPHHTNNLASSYGMDSDSSTPRSFGKLSVSDAIGLVTIRLSKLEQWMLDTEAKDSSNNNNNNQGDATGTATAATAAANGGGVDMTMVQSIVQRLDGLEKRAAAEVPQISPTLETDVKWCRDQVQKLSMDTARHAEQLLRMQRDMVETKDLLKAFMLKYDNFANDTTLKFGDYEFAIGELEKQMESVVATSTVSDSSITASMIEEEQEGTSLSALPVLSALPPPSATSGVSPPPPSSTTDTVASDVRSSSSSSSGTVHLKIDEIDM